MKELNFSAFKEKSANIPVKELAITGICLIVGMIVFVFVLETVRMTFALNDGVVSMLNTWIGGPVTFGILLWTLSYTLKFSKNKKINLFKSFAASNGFTFGGRDLQLDKMRLLDFGPNMHVGSEFCLYGTYRAREFKLNLVTAQNIAYSRSFPFFYGVLKLTLNRSYSHNVFQHPNHPHGLVIPDDAGKISTEIIGSHLYFVRQEGFDMTPEGMTKIFELIKNVDAIDPPAPAS